MMLAFVLMTIMTLGACATPTAGRADGFAYSQPQHGR
jgi:hypothetical protein